MKSRLKTKKIILSALLLFLSLSIFAQEKITVTGKVTDIDGEAVAFADVKIKNTKIEAETTDKEGNFKIEVPSPKSTLVFSYPELKTTEIYLNGRTELNVVLHNEEFRTDEDIIALPYVYLKKRYVSGAVNDVYVDKLREQPIANVDALLQGRFAGVRVVNNSGVPGSGATIRIRGNTSLNSGNQPLYVVDGVAVRSEVIDEPLSEGVYNSNILDINPGDIASFTVLKDADATSIYGAKAANGVVIINTHKGIDGKTSLAVSMYGGLQQMTRDIPVLNSDEYRSYALDLLYDGGMNADQIATKYGRPLFNDPNYHAKERFNNNTNWTDQVVRTGVVSDYHFNLKVGDGVSRYAFMLGYTNIEGILKNMNYERMSARMNMNYKISDKYQFENNISFARTEQKQHMQGLSKYNPLWLAKTKSPFLSVFEQNKEGIDKPIIDGVDFAGKTNPKALFNKMKNENMRTRVGIASALLYTPSVNWKVKASLNLDYNGQKETLFIPHAGVALDKEAERSSAVQMSKEFVYASQNNITYNKMFGTDHNLSALMGVDYQYNIIKVRKARTMNSLSDEFNATHQGILIDTIGNMDEKWAQLSAYAKVNYMYRDKYGLSLTTRGDASSRFGYKKALAVFPAIGLSWRVGEESFMDFIPEMNEFKIRASYGFSGNENFRDHMFKTAYAAANYQGLGGIKIEYIGNPNLKWEQTRQFNIGANCAFFNSRLNFNVDYYVKQTSDLITYKHLPRTSGFGLMLTNLGAIENKGIEFSLNARVLNKAFKWDIDFTIATNECIITELPEGKDIIFEMNGFKTIAREGQPFGAFYGLQTNGIYLSEDELNLKNGTGNEYSAFRMGDMKFIDQNGDGYILSRDAYIENDDKIHKSDEVIIGNPNPDYYGGILNRFSYKGFELDIFVEYQQGNDVINAFRAAMEGMTGLDNQATTVKQRWKKVGDITDIPRLSYNDAVGNARASDRWVEDGSYIRLKKVTLAYNIPKNLLSGIKMLKGARIFITGQNLFTHTKYLGLDPEFNNSNLGIMPGIDFGSLPQVRSLIAGLKFNF